MIKSLVVALSLLISCSAFAQKKGARISWEHDPDPSTEVIEVFNGWYTLEWRIDDQDQTVYETNNKEFWIRFNEPLEAGQQVCVRVQAAVGQERSAFTDEVCASVEVVEGGALALVAPSGVTIELVD